MTEEIEAAGAPSEPPTEVTPEASLAEARAEVWAKYEAPEADNDTADGAPAPVEEPAAPDAEGPDAADVEGEAEPAPEAPGYLPRGVKEQWGNIPDAARDAFSTAYRELSDKFGQASREINALGPIRQALTESIKAHPEIANMKPADVAAQLPGLVAAGQQIARDPVKALYNLAKQHNVLDKFAATFNQNGDQALMQRNQALEREIAELKRGVDPRNLRQQFEQWNMETAVQRTVAEFQATAEAWNEVEPYLPHFIPVAEAKLGANASEADLLRAAYEMAVKELVPEKASRPPAADEAAPEVDPGKAQEALKAKSVNLKGKSSDRPKPASLDQARKQIWRQAQMG